MEKINTRQYYDAIKSAYLELHNAEFIQSKSPLLEYTFNEKKPNPRQIMFHATTHSEAGNFSFKDRGAAYAMTVAKANDASAKIVAASAGNHSQGVAAAANKLEMDAMIMMPETTPINKVAATLRLGGAKIPYEQIEKGEITSSAELIAYFDEHKEELGKVTVKIDGFNIFDEALQAALSFTEAEGAVFIPPFDHPDIIAGAGTHAFDIVENLINKGNDQNINILALMEGDPDSLEAKVKEALAQTGIDEGKGVHLHIPVGGGGLIAGVSIVLKELMPACKITAVESEQANSLTVSLAEGEKRKVDVPPRYADGSKLAGGTAVSEVGEIPLQILRQLNVNATTISQKQMQWGAAKMNFGMEMRSEMPTGAALASSLNQNLPSQYEVLLVTGENLDPEVEKQLKTKVLKGELKIGQNREISGDGAPEVFPRAKELTQYIG